MPQFTLHPLYPGAKASIYSVIRQGNQETDLELFFKKFSHKVFARDTRYLADMLFVQIADRLGADPAFFYET